VFTDPLLRNGFFCCCMGVHFRGNPFAELLCSNELFRLSSVMSHGSLLKVIRPYRRTDISSFPEGCAWFHFPSRGSFFPTPPADPSLRPLVPSGSHIGYQSVQVYYRLVRSEVPRIDNGPIFLTLRLLVASFSVSEGTDPSTMSNPSFLLS
jgi:hypothetical protein